MGKEWTIRSLALTGLELASLVAVTSCGQVGERRQPGVSILNPPTKPVTTDVTGYELDFTALNATRLEAYQSPDNKPLPIDLAQSWQVWRQGKNTVHVDVPEGESKVTIRALDCYQDQGIERCTSSEQYAQFVKDSKGPDIWPMGSRVENGQMIFKFKVADVSSIPQMILRSPDGKDVVGTFKNLGDGFVEFTIRPESVGDRPLELNAVDSYGHDGRYEFVGQYAPAPDTSITEPSSDGSFTIQGKLDSNLKPDLSAQGNVFEVPGLPLRQNISCGEPNVDTSTGTFTIQCQSDASHGKGEISIKTTDVNGMPVQKTLAVQFPDAPGEEVAFVYGFIGVSAIVGGFFILQTLRRGLSWYVNRKFDQALSSNTYGGYEKAQKIKDVFPGMLPSAEGQIFQSRFRDAIRAASSLGEEALHDPDRLSQTLDIPPHSIEAVIFHMREKLNQVSGAIGLAKRINRSSPYESDPLVQLYQEMGKLIEEVGVTSTIDVLKESSAYKIASLLVDVEQNGAKAQFFFNPATYIGWTTSTLRRLAECCLSHGNFGAADFVIAQAKGELVDLSLQIRAMEKRQAKIHDPDDEVEI